jgi:hypothetical protein
MIASFRWVHSFAAALDVPHQRRWRIGEDETLQ